MSKRILILFGQVLLLLCVNSAVSVCPGQSTENRNAQTVSPADQATELAEATRLNNKAVEFYNQAHYDEALPLAERSLEIRERYLRPDDNLVLTSAFNLAA